MSVDRNDQDTGKELSEDEHTPSLSEIFDKDPPHEYYPIMVISGIICTVIIALFIKAANEHRKYTTKFTMQSLCTVGIILVFPVFAVMYFSGMVVPKSMPQVTFIAETYEAISLFFFLRLLFTYMGGKKKTVACLKSQSKQAALNSPPLCCLVCLPHVNVSRKFICLNELFIIQLLVLQLVLGYVDLMIGLDESHSYPAALIEEKYSHYFHIFILVSLAFAVYGLGGIYHSAEKDLAQYKIFKKFVLYKAFVTVVKFEELLVSILLKYLIKGTGVSLSKGAFSAHLRVHFWCYFVILIEAMTVFPFLLKEYSTKDYPNNIDTVSIPETAAYRLVECGDELITEQYESFPAALTIEESRKPDVL